MVGAVRLKGGGKKCSNQAEANIWWHLDDIKYTKSVAMTNLLNMVGNRPKTQREPCQVQRYESFRSAWLPRLPWERTVVNKSDGSVVKSITSPACRRQPHLPFPCCHHGNHQSKSTLSEISAFARALWMTWAAKGTKREQFLFDLILLLPSTGALGVILEAIPSRHSNSNTFNLVCKIGNVKLIFLLKIWRNSHFVFWESSYQWNGPLDSQSRFFKGCSHPLIGTKAFSCIQTIVDGLSKLFCPKKSELLLLSRIIAIITTKAHFE